MTASRKKAQEMNFFGFAQQLRPDLLPSGVQDGTGENPDILVHGEGWTYGVEVTGMLSQEEKAQERVRREVCDMAKKDASLPPGFSVAVLFRREKFIGARQERVWLSTRLVELVNAEVEKHSSYEKWGTEIKLWGSDLWAWATQVFIHFIPNYPETIWYSQDGWGVGPLRPDVIRARVHAKEQRLPDYRRRAPRIVLLLVISGYSGSESSYVPEVSRQAIYRTDFDEVLLLDLMNAELLRLDLEPLSAADVAPQASA